MTRTVITPPGRFDLPRWRELWAAREVLLRFGQRDVLLRYRQTAVGVVWVVLQPLVAAGVFSIVFGGLAKLPSGGVPYFVFSYVGMLAWNLFSSVVTRSAGSLVANQALVSKVFFPRLLVPASTIVAALVDFAVSFVLGVGLVVWAGAWPGWQVLTLALWVPAALCLGLGVGVAASAVMVKYRDVAYVVPWLVQIGLYASPVAFSLEAVPESVRWMYTANPMTWVLEGFRYAMLGAPSPPLWQWLATAGASVVVLLGGVLVFQRFERGFADLI